MTEYALFLEKCSKYGVVSKVPENTYLSLSNQYREKNFTQIVDSALQWLQSKTLDELNAMRGKKGKRLKEKELRSQRIHTFARIAKEKQQKDELSRHEYFQKQNEENDAKRQANMKKRDQRAREKARIPEFEEPDARQVKQAVLDFKAKYPQRYEDGIKYFIKKSLEEHPDGMRFFGVDKARLLAKARLNALLESKLK